MCTLCLRPQVLHGGRVIEEPWMTLGSQAKHESFLGPFESMSSP
jgi:hypothetical protein